MSMTNEEFLEQEKLIKESMNTRITDLCRKFCRENSRYKDDDIIKGDGIVIKIIGRHISRINSYSVPSLSYKGYVLTKKLEPKKNNEIGYIRFESAEKV